MIYEELTDTIIEALIVSDFIPGDHEAYAYVCSDAKFKMARLQDFFLKMLAKLDWDYIETCVASVKEEL